VRVAVAVLVLVAAASGAGATAARPAAQPTPLQRELSGLATRMEQLHPNLFHATPRSRFRAAAAELARRAPGLSRAQLVVGVMRLVALAGPRDGHTGVYPLDPGHPRPLAFYPLRLYDFADGLHVVAAAGRPELVGKRLTAIGGTPLSRVLELVRPLVPRDNEWSRRWLLPEYLVTAEVLVGVGLANVAGATFQFADGTSATLSPVAAAEYVAVHGSALDHPLPARPPLWLREREREHWLTPIDGGRAVYLAYRVTSYPDPALVARLIRLGGRASVRRIVVDVRLNHGGNNQTYGPLVDALQRPAIGRKAVLLVGRATFSAAGNLAAEVAVRTRTRLVGEPPGGAPNQWGDSTPLPLPRAGLQAHVSGVYVEVAPSLGARAALRPDVRVEETSADFFAGRDPVLARALR
jgi:hypothetical protein